MWNVGAVLNGTGSEDSKYFMLMGAAGFVFFGYKMFRVGKK
jgi:hypothetical protein